MTVWLSFLLALGMTLCAQSIAYANPPIGSGINRGGRTVIGTLEVFGKQVFVDGTLASTGSRVYDDSRVVTGSGSSCLINLESGGSVQLDENTDPVFSPCGPGTTGYCGKNEFCLEIASGQIFEIGHCVHTRTPDASLHASSEGNIDLRSGSTILTVAEGEFRLSSPTSNVSNAVRPYEQVTVSSHRIVEHRRVTPAELANIIAWRVKYFRTRICGTVDDAQGQAAKGVGITVKDASGSTIGQAATDNNGNYRIGNLIMGRLNLFLEPGSSGFQSGSGILDLSGKSERVNWQVSSGSSAVASQAGSCELTPVEWVAIGVLGFAAAGAGACAAYCPATPNN